MNKLILIIGLTIFLASCQASSTSQSVDNFGSTNPDMMPQKFSNDYQAGNPVENAYQAQGVALKALKESFTYVEPLVVVHVEKMSYGESKQLIEQPLNRQPILKYG